MPVYAKHLPITLLGRHACVYLLLGSFSKSNISRQVKWPFTVLMTNEQMTHMLWISEYCPVPMMSCQRQDGDVR